MSTDARPGLMELRIALKMGIADLLITRKTRKDLLELEEMLMHEAAGPTGDVSKQNKVDFQSKLFQKARNDYMEKIHPLLEQIFRGRIPGGLSGNPRGHPSGTEKRACRIAPAGNPFLPAAPYGYHQKDEGS